MNDKQKSIIKALCFTDINPAYLINPTNPEWIRLLAICDQKQERLTRELTEDLRPILEELKEKNQDKNQIELEHWFFHGVCLGAKIIMEICLEPTTEKPIPAWLIEHLRKVEIT